MPPSTGSVLHPKAEPAHPTSTDRHRTVTGMTCLAAVHAVLPPHRYPQDKITEAFAEHVLGDGGSHEVLRRVHTNTRVGSRYLALPLDRYRQLTDFTEANNAFWERSIWASRR